ncbi:MAG: hypothetical protein ACOCV8_05090, partial [Spirochaetota bacterium]
LVSRLKFDVKNNTEWQSLKVNDIKMDFDFVNLYVKELHEGVKYTNKVAISEIEFLVKDNTSTLTKDKYKYLYDDLENWYRNNDEYQIIERTASKYFYPEYNFSYKSFGYDDWFRDQYKSREYRITYVPTFDKACELVGMSDIPEEQYDFIKSLEIKGNSHRTFDLAKSRALVYSTYRSRKYRDTFFVYLDKPKFNEENLEELPIYFPFTPILGQNLINPEFRNKLEKADPLLDTYLRYYFNENDDLDQIFIVRTYNGNATGPLKYVLYYPNLKEESQRITSLSITDPVFMFIFDKKGRLIKVYHKEYGDEKHYYLIWDKKNKIEKVLILEIGDFGLKRIRKVISERKVIPEK